MTQLKPRWHMIGGASLVALVVLLNFGRFLSYANPTSPVPASPHAAHIALMGNVTDVAMLTGPFIARGELKPVRKYPVQPMAVIEEAETDYFPDGYPAGLTLRLFEVTTSTAQVESVISQVIDATTAYRNLVAEAEDLAWLTYLPKQFLISGDCGEIDLIIDSAQVIDDIDLQDTILLPLNPYPACKEIRLYDIFTATRVIDMVDLINAHVPVGTKVFAEPNYLAVAAQEYIAGSPGGPLAPDAPPLDIGSMLTEPGLNIWVAILDTMPYNILPGQTALVNIDGVSVTASNPFELPANLPTGENPVLAHGTFVASPITRLAPEAEVHLVRVLNEYGMGDVHSVIKAMRPLIDDVLALGAELDGVVFNYSFVLETPADSDDRSAIQFFLNYVDALNIFQVASSGNDSAYTDTPQPMPLPAAHEAVLGVTAVTDQGVIACYANQGQIAAPGGGIPRGALCDTDEIVKECAEAADLAICKTGWDPMTSSTQFAWGIGTSFAAPVVSGLAAQIMDALSLSLLDGRSQTVVAGKLNGWPEPSLVRAHLFSLASGACDPTLGSGVLLASETIYNCSNYLPIILRP